MSMDFKNIFSVGQICGIDHKLQMQLFIVFIVRQINKQLSFFCFTKNDIFHFCIPFPPFIRIQTDFLIGNFCHRVINLKAGTFT